MSASLGFRLIRFGRRSAAAQRFSRVERPPPPTSPLGRFFYGRAAAFRPASRRF